MPLIETKSPQRNGLLIIIKIPFAKLAKESFNTKPTARAIVPKDTSKPEVDNSRTDAASKTAPIIHAMQILTTTIHIAKSNLKPYSEISV